MQDRLVKEMRLAGIGDMDSANAWLPGYIGQYNRRFAVKPKDPLDARPAYPGTEETLLRALSVRTIRTLSKNISCQYENQVLQIETTGAGLGLRGAKVTAHERFDGSRELLWKKRKLACGATNKAVRQMPVTDGKTVNARVEKAMSKRNTAHKPAADHPWRKCPPGSPPTTGVALHRSEERAG